MKKSILVCLALGLVLTFGSIAMAGTTPGTGIVGTYHDLSSTGNSATMGDTADQANLNRICIYCHAPHNTLKPELTVNTYRPLWNHDPSANTTFTMYQNTITGDTPNQLAHQSQAMILLVGVTTPGAVSMLCLSCHDGTTATNSYGTVQTDEAKGLADKFVTARANIGGATGDLSNHHPIGFSYDNTVTGGDDEIHLSTNAVPQGGAGGVKLGGPATISDLLWNGNVECVSCHDVHNTKNGGNKFTWVQDTQSALCMTCHVKDGSVQ